MDNEAPTSFTCYPTCASDGSTLTGLFSPVFILRTPAFIAPWAPFYPTETLTTVLGATCAPAFGAAAFGRALVFGVAYGGAEAALDESAPVPFCATITFRAVIFFFPAIFIHFPTSPRLPSVFLFLVASLLASVPGSGSGP
jgi:hypothetical protein